MLVPINETSVTIGGTPTLLPSRTVTWKWRAESLRRNQASFKNSKEVSKSNFVSRNSDDLSEEGGYDANDRASFCLMEGALMGEDNGPTLNDLVSGGAPGSAPPASLAELSNSSPAAGVVGNGDVGMFRHVFMTLYLNISYVIINS